MRCAICEQPVSPLEAIRFSNTQPPISDRMRGGFRVAVVAGAAGAFASTIRAAVAGVPEETYHFHPSCWRTFSADLLSHG